MRMRSGNQLIWDCWGQSANRRLVTVVKIHRYKLWLVDIQLFRYLFFYFTSLLLLSQYIDETQQRHWWWPRACRGSSHPKSVSLWLVMLPFKRFPIIWTASREETSIPSAQASYWTPCPWDSQVGCVHWLLISLIWELSIYIYGSLLWGIFPYYGTVPLFWNCPLNMELSLIGTVLGMTWA